MSKILSQDEIDALLESSSTIAPVSGAPAARGPNGAMAAAYNFRRPDRISKEQLRSLHFLHDRFAHNVSTSLSAFLRSVTEVTIVSVEQFAYSEFLMSLPEQTAFYAVGLVARTGDNFTTTEFWRFWVVHLWVEDFLELFTTVMVAYMFVLLGVVREKIALAPATDPPAAIGSNRLATRLTRRGRPGQDS